MNRLKMSKDDAYYLHQTPTELAKKLIEIVPLQVGDVVYEPFRGEGAFYNSLPSTIVPKWSELVEGRDYKDFNESYDWVITNPPFRLQEQEKRVNSFWLLMDYFTDRATKGVAFLGNDQCFSALTPARIKKLADKGWYIQTIHVCAVKKWRGRYFFLVLSKKPSTLYSALSGTY
jgi:hypothetical protein